jgi:hypothetical protein
MDATGKRATVELRNGTSHRMKISKELHEQFLRDLQAAGSLNALPANHCMKSASFGSSLYVEYHGVRSPDLSCPEQVDPRTKALKSDAGKILRAARNQ